MNQRNTLKKNIINNILSQYYTNILSIRILFLKIIYYEFKLIITNI